MKIFITGTDTEIGKTYVSAHILKAFNKKGLSTLGIKPIATGCDPHNDDALELQKSSSIKLPYDKINPISFPELIAPNIAAQKNNYNLNLNILNKKTEFALNYPADLCLIEGIGGWHVPLNKHETMADFVKTNNLPVILVIGIKLGCLNHGILTYQAIKNSNVPCVGWIANCLIPNMKFVQENILTLKKFLEAPLLTTIGYKQNTPIDFYHKTFSQQ